MWVATAMVHSKRPPLCIPSSHSATRQLISSIPFLASPGHFGHAILFMQAKLQKQITTLEPQVKAAKAMGTNDPSRKTKEMVKLITHAAQTFEKKIEGTGDINVEELSGGAKIARVRGFFVPWSPEPLNGSTPASVHLRPTHSQPTALSCISILLRMPSFPLVDHVLRPPLHRSALPPYCCYCWPVVLLPRRNRYSTSGSHLNWCA